MSHPTKNWEMYSSRDDVVAFWTCPYCHRTLKEDHDSIHREYYLRCDECKARWIFQGTPPIDHAPEDAWMQIGVSRTQLLLEEE